MLLFSMYVFIHYFILVCCLPLPSSLSSLNIIPNQTKLSDSIAHAWQVLELLLRICRLTLFQILPSVPSLIRLQHSMAASKWQNYCNFNYSDYLVLNFSQDQVETWSEVKLNFSEKFLNLIDWILQDGAHWLDIYRLIALSCIGSFNISETEPKCTR